MPKYYFAAASKKFFLEEEPIEEVLRERTNYYNSINKPIDFWLLIDPDFLNSKELIYVQSRIKKPSAAIVSTNPVFINWIKLRVSYVITGETEDNILRGIIA
uniref:Ycf54 n=1 Tax=Porphyridium sordidum TaxID=28024 RepID=A0A1C9CDV1_PORSO|nr:hypothetical protein Psor_067 [Porphyridium sordidum]AOM66542.1 hypothetical protein Psor_067 [Porphyridium sordidum]